MEVDGDVCAHIVCEGLEDHGLDALLDVLADRPVTELTADETSALKVALDAACRESDDDALAAAEIEPPDAPPTKTGLDEREARVAPVPVPLGCW